LYFRSEKIRTKLRIEPRNVEATPIKKAYTRERERSLMSEGVNTNLRYSKLREDKLNKK